MSTRLTPGVRAILVVGIEAAGSIPTACRAFPGVGCRPFCDGLAAAGTDAHPNPFRDRHSRLLTFSGSIVPVSKPSTNGPEATFFQ